MSLPWGSAIIRAILNERLRGGRWQDFGTDFPEVIGQYDLTGRRGKDGI